MTQKKIKKKESVIIQNYDKKEVGVVQSLVTKKGITYYTVLLEKGAIVQDITTNPEYPMHIIDPSRLKPISGQSLKANIEADEIIIEDDSTYTPPTEL